jgi:hypothetical protein
MTDIKKYEKFILWHIMNAKKWTWSLVSSITFLSELKIDFYGSKIE